MLVTMSVSRHGRTLDFKATLTYNQNSKVFNVDYKYTADGKTYQMVGTFTYQDEDAGSN